MTDRNVFESESNPKADIDAIIDQIKTLTELCRVAVKPIDKKTVEYIYPDGTHIRVDSSDFIDSDMNKNTFISCLIASLVRACEMLEVGETGFDILMTQCVSTAKLTGKDKDDKKKEKKGK